MIPASVTSTQLKLVQLALGISGDELVTDLHITTDQGRHDSRISVTTYRLDSDGEVLIVDDKALTATYDIGVDYT